MSPTDASLILPNPGTVGSLGYNKNLIIASGGGGSTRPAQDWPFAATAIWNTSLGDGVAPTTDGADPTRVAGYFSGIQVNNWVNGYGRSVWYGNSPDVNRTQASDKAVMEGHYAEIGKVANYWAGQHVDDRYWAADFYQHDHPTAPAYTIVQVDLRGMGFPTQAMVWKGNGSAWGHVNVAGWSNLAGLARTYDFRVLAVDRGYIPHTLKGTLNRNLLQRASRGSGHTWPADTSDSGWNTVNGPAEYLGWAPIGSLLYIPWGTTKPAGLSALGSILFETLRRYGFYVSDSSQNANSQWEVECNLENYVHAPSGQNFKSWTTSGELGTIFGMLVRAVNNAPANPGGPGNRRVTAVIPAFA